MMSKPMTAIPVLEHSNDGFNTENLRQCKNCVHWIFYWCIDTVLSPKGWYHYVKLYNPRVSDKLRNKDRKRCFGFDYVVSDGKSKRILCTCTKPEPDPNGKTWDEAHNIYEVE